jgi:hypothetical protein
LANVASDADGIVLAASPDDLVPAMNESPADQLGNVLTPTADGVELHVKAVPGASRTRIVGVLGERLKITLAAPPQQGQANIALCKLLAQTLGIAVRNVRITAGAGSAQKTVELVGVDLNTATEKLQTMVKA